MKIQLKKTLRNLWFVPENAIIKYRRKKEPTIPKGIFLIYFVFVKEIVIKTANSYNIFADTIFNCNTLLSKVTIKVTNVLLLNYQKRTFFC